MGGQLGWLGDSALIFLQFWCECMLCGYDAVILECTSGFDLDGLQSIGASRDYHVVCLHICPRDLGFPNSRKRKYMLFTRVGRLRWKQSVQAIGHEKVFGHIFHRAPRMFGDQLMRAPRNEVEAYMNHLRSQRGLPAVRKSGKAWTCFQILSPARRARVLQHEASVNRQRGSKTSRSLCNILQSPRFMPATDHSPAMLQKTTLWSMRHQRVTTPMEQLEIMGYQVWGCRPSTSPWVDALASLTYAQQQSVGGNGMHAAAIGSAIMFLLGCTEPVQPRPGCAFGSGSAA